MNRTVNGVLLLYHLPLAPSATTITEHVQAFPTYSRFKVWALNTELGFPPGLRDLRFSAIVLHYSLFGTRHYRLSQEYLDYLARATSSLKIAFCQDEFQYGPQRFAFINQYGIDYVYSLLDSAHVDKVYGRYTPACQVRHTLTGYVSPAFVAIARELERPDEQRTIDIGYRARRLDFYMGKGGQEKHRIADELERRAAGRGLVLDLSTDESRRLYGRSWHEFLANCRGVLGVEAGVSVFDPEDTIRPECERRLARNPRLTFEELYDDLLVHWEERIPYRTIGPRHFEAAAFRACQIMFEGAYQGILQPMVHYIPLKKDFSNFEEVLRLFLDRDVRRELTANAYRDLIASGRYSYRSFIEAFDDELLRAGLSPELSPAAAAGVDRLLAKGHIYRQACARVRAMRYVSFPGRAAMRSVVRPMVHRLRGEGTA